MAATQAEKEQTVLDVSEALKAAEDALESVVKGIVKGFSQDILKSKPERDEHAETIRAIKHALMAEHSRLTGIALREGIDIVTDLGGPGR